MTSRAIEVNLTEKTALVTGASSGIGARGSGGIDS